MFMLLFGIIILVCVDIVPNKYFQVYTTLAFWVGGATSMFCGYLGMYIATYSNTIVTYNCQNSIHGDKALDKGFKIAFQAGCAIGFILTGLSLFTLTVMINIYRVMH